MEIPRIPEQQFPSEAESRAFRYAQGYKNCCQCTLLALQELFNLDGGDTLKAATGFVGGIGRTGSVCGYEKHCPSVMAKGARWAAEIILKERGLR